MNSQPCKKHLPLTVFVRIKPDKNDIEYTSKTICIHNNKQQLVEYTFDGVFPPSSQTSEIYDMILPALQESPFGTRHISLLAYGQTGSGKTYTMLGSDESPGLITLIVKNLCSKGPITVSFIEIYNEKAIDLLDNREKPLRESDGTVCIQGLLTKTIISASNFDSLALRAFSLRKSAATALNERSSRSHLLIRIRSASLEITLVDLAGAENNRKTCNSGMRMEESLNINRSLFVLNKVVKSISMGERRIPYRDSKLTRLLSHSIGGTGKCFLIGTIINNYKTFSEASHTLGFATSAKKVKNSSDPTVNSIPSPTNLVKNVSVACSDSIKHLPGAKHRITARHASNNSSTQNNSLSSMHSIEKQAVEMTPITKQKSYECFLAQAQAQESQHRFKEALSTYKIIKRFADSELIDSKISEIHNRIKRVKKKLPSIRVLEILNSGDFLRIKQLNGIGDRRAQIVVDFISGGNFFESLSDLRMVFSDKVTKNVLESVEE